MNYWNLLVVLCFAVLYLGVSIVFTRLRRVQNEMREDHIQTRAWQGERAEERARLAEQKLAALEERIAMKIQEMGSDWAGEKLAAVEERLDRRIQTMGEVLQGDLQILYGAVRSNNGQEDIYREARLLLSYDIDEERVAKETGRSMEEIRLLKRVTGSKQRFAPGISPPAVQPIPSKAVGSRWGYPPMDRFDVVEDGRVEDGRSERVITETVHTVYPANQDQEVHANLIMPDPENSAPLVTSRGQQKRQGRGGRWRQNRNRAPLEFQSSHPIQSGSTLLPVRSSAGRS